MEFEETIRYRVARWVMVVVIAAMVALMVQMLREPPHPMLDEPLYFPGLPLRLPEDHPTDRLNM